MRFVATRAFGALMLAALTVVALTGATAFAGSSGNGGGGLSKHDRALLATARANGDSTISVLVATVPGGSKSVASGIEGLGGTLR